MSELSRMLDTYHTATLRQMAEEAGLNVKDSGGRKNLSKPELHKLMEREFFTRERTLTALKRLNERERTVLDRLLLRGGEAGSRSFQRELVRAKIVTESTQEEEVERYHYFSRAATYGRPGYAGGIARPNSTIFEDVLARLAYFGLVFSLGAPPTSGGTAYKLRFQPAKQLFIPQAILPFLPEPEPTPDEWVDWNPTRIKAGDPTLLLRDLYLYWDFTRQNSIDLIQSGFVGKRSLKALNEVLLVADPQLNQVQREDNTYRLYLLRQLLHSLDLIKIRQNKIVPVPEASATFWSSTVFKQVSDCLQAWLLLYDLNELTDQAQQYDPNYIQARQKVFAVLQKLPTDRWHSQTELFEYVQDLDMDFLFAVHSRVDNSSSTRYSNYYGGTYFYGNRNDLLVKFEQYEKQFVDYFLTGILHPLGLIDLGYEGDAETTYAFRLTPLGQAVLGKIKPEQLPPPDTGKIIIQPNFHLLAMGPVSLALLAQFDQFADRQQVDRGVFEYQITRDSIYRAQQLDLPVEDIIKTLTDVSGQPLPQNIHRSLQEWGTHHERIVFRTGISLLQAANADLLTQLLDTPQTNQHITRALTPEVALVDKKEESALVAELITHNILPVKSGAKPEAADHSLIIHADGAIEPVHAVPSLHLRGRLARLAEEDTAGHWQLTQKTISRAGGSKNKVLNILAELGKLQRGELPAKLVPQIKAWGNYFGQAATETLTLIEFRDREIMTELVDHPDLTDLLTPFPTTDRALAIVTAKKLAQVKKILDSMGVQVKGKLQP